MSRDQTRVQKVLWPEVRTKVRNVNPGLADAIDMVDPGSKFPLYVVRYGYGDLIVDNGRFQLPINEGGKLATLKNAPYPDSIKEALGYGDGKIVMGVILKNSMEVGIKPSDLVLPSSFYPQGSIFGLWGYLESGISFLHPSHIFTLTAGARCVVLLPRVGQDKGYKSLIRRAGCCIDPPINLHDHHRMFVDIVRDPNLNCDWRAELLFFPKTWYDKLQKKDQRWLVLKEFLLDWAWIKSAYCRNKYLYDSAFSWAQANRNLRFDPYLIDTAKFLIGVGSGFYPAFMPALDEIALPTKLIQSVFLEGYGLRKYVPTIMQPAYFDPITPGRPIYYSLRFPTTHEFSPRARKDLVALQDICNLRYITLRFLEELANGKVRMMHTILEFVAKNITFDFYHRRSDRYGEVSLTESLPKLDKNLLYSLKPTRNKKFAADSPFLQGCVMIRGEGRERDSV